jgi:hypothetical protein
MSKDQLKPQSGGIKRFLNAIPSLHPGEILSSMLEEYALFRRIVFGVLLVAALIWASWGIVLLVLGVWALAEGTAYLTNLWRSYWR